MADLAAYLSKAGISYRDKGTNVAANNLNICCIFCGEVRFHLGIERDELWYYCWVCGKHGRWNQLAKKLSKSHPSIDWNSLSPIGQEHFIDQKQEVKVQQEEELSRPLTDNDSNVWEWLTTKPNLEDLDWENRPRGFSKQVLLDSGIRVGIGRLKGYIVFDQPGGINARRYSSDIGGPRWWKRFSGDKFLFGSQWCSRVQPEVGFICEGIFDCLRLPIGSAVAILGSVVSESLVSQISKTFITTKKLVLALDKDSNIEQVGRLRLLLVDCGYEVETLDWNSINIPKVKDLDELSIVKGEEFLKEFVGIDKVETLL